MSDLEEMTEEAIQSFERFMENQLNLYIERLKDAPDIPTTVLTEAHSLRSVQRDKKPDPPFLFKNWVNVYILYDSWDQMEMWIDIARGWMENAAVLAGMESLLEIAPEIEFNQRDGRLLRWLSERSRRNAQLIQGVTDEDVHMTLWDVVYEGHFSIKIATDALIDTYGFSKSRAETIARTEIISAGRAGQYHGDLQSGIVIGKRWRAALQERTRDHHRIADGQVVAFDEPFIVNGEYLMFPGDSSLGAGGGNTINCRCWYERILEGEELK
ncbi:hypothetical protein F7731_23600 [Cytobacillus depressus]|uniref:Phage head morphogenesis domain-containing protein n=1 Tax=Cytobacillus depressus TaxID=1602942 RepID=A0A6L3V0H3_9BACI|nr:phage minor head protein [Cytobacillus depressus]KAB2328941.1 hypothetical protein F7731_23600 [Cytobacillus depressus]